MSLKTMIEEKKAWNDLGKRVKKLPNDYQIVYKEMQTYLFKVATLDESQMMELYTGIVELFEYGAIVEKEVLEVTGKDVAAFCDELIVGLPSYDEYFTHHFQKISEDLVYSKISVVEKLLEQYGEENLTPVATDINTSKRYLLGITAASMVSPIGVGSSGILPKYYLYKEEKIIRLTGTEISEHKVDRIKDNRYLANNMWFAKAEPKE
ncbi:DUF1048 domain-containing protein [Mollicutes bacterium LVI A0039]|nr:DUF1048 domain-containing protein [Mollicutes bacterium LVI A0039]